MPYFPDITILKAKQEKFDIEFPIDENNITLTQKIVDR